LTRYGRSREDCEVEPRESRRKSNPLELISAVTFAVIFLTVLVVTRLVADRFGNTGLLVLAAIMGAADVDPFILGLTQTVGVTLDVGTAALAVIIASAMNNLMKGIYALIFGAAHTGRLSFVLLAFLGALSVVLFWVF
jgi:uncharacterized membrane protein (DUF4010 family)